MIEADIEARLAEVLKKALGDETIQCLTAWGVAADGAVKAQEGADASGYLTIKVAPRQYETFTVPKANFTATIQLDLRAETDFDGARIKSAASAITSVIWAWQDSFLLFAGDFADIARFTPIGFRLDGGDVGIDRAARVWTFSQNLTICGVVAKE